jgi:CRISPR-associated protein Csm4
MNPEKTYLIRLYFKNALRVGAARSGVGIEASQDYIHSDTFWAALANYWALLGSAGGISFAEFLEGFGIGSTSSGASSGVPPLFTISSAFLFARRSGMHRYWLPKPLSVPFDLSTSNSKESRDSERENYGKAMKQARLLSDETFTNWQAFGDLVGYAVSNNNSMASVGKNNVRPQSSLDRITSKSNLFHSGISYLNPNDNDEGLYVLVKTSDDRVEEALKEVLAVIRDAGGLGGDISSGCGELLSYSIELIGNNDEKWAFLRERSDANARCLLSLCLPSNPKTVSAKLVAYNTVLRKGWTGSLTAGLQRKRQTLYMLSEGTVFAGEEQGQMATITPAPTKTPDWTGQHPVYRYGYAFSVPIKINFED